MSDKIKSKPEELSDEVLDVIVGGSLFSFASGLMKYVSGGSAAPKAYRDVLDKAINITNKVLK